MNCFCQSDIAGNLFIVEETRNAAIALGMFIDAIVFRDQKTPSALGFFFHISDIALCDHAVFCAEVHNHCRNDKAVGNCAGADLIRCE